MMSISTYKNLLQTYFIDLQIKSKHLYSKTNCVHNLLTTPGKLLKKGVFLLELVLLMNLYASFLGETKQVLPKIM
jgi:hypothetical protein